jgi:hypothetical protein
VIPCLSQGLQQMKSGGKARFVCPPRPPTGTSPPTPRSSPGRRWCSRWSCWKSSPTPPSAWRRGQGGQAPPTQR